MIRMIRMIRVEYKTVNTSKDKVKNTLLKVFPRQLKIHNLIILNRARSCHLNKVHFTCRTTFERDGIHIHDDIPRPI